MIKVKRVVTTEILAFKVVTSSREDIIYCQIFPIDNEAKLIAINNEMLDFDEQFSKYF